ncbi:MAG TPA: SAM-dependent methyltransferase, partial [Flavisolibacter sp.]|nr:SAM-dependent methyltransferase [Flavisolibacter sp.]
IKDVSHEVTNNFRQAIRNGKTIAILSEAGCPGVADPGQKLIYLAQEMNATVRPLVGPSSILLALMASGMNGQHFQFVGYLPIEPGDRVRKINSLETKSKQDNVTQIFIETPYRNNQLMEFLVKNCHPSTKVCVAVDLTADTELVRTKTVQQWKTEKLELHKRPAIFLLYAGE